MVNSTKHFQRRINDANPSHSLPKSMRIGLFQTCFINSASPWYPNQRGRAMSRENYRPVFLMNLYAEVLNKIFHNTRKWPYTMIKWALFQGCKDVSLQSVSVHTTSALTTLASLTPWAWIWANSRRAWRTEEPGVL